jgi:Mat/Ecp fimbriae major subunit
LLNKLKGPIYMLNKMKIALAGTIAAAAMFSSAAQAETATATAEIVTAATLTNTTDLNFGSIAIGAAGGSVAVAATSTGTRACTTVICIGTTSSAADFTIGGASGATVGLTITNAAITLTNGTSTLNAALALSSATSVVGNVEYVGGTLTVPVASTAGTYTGSFEVTALYQ